MEKLDEYLASVVDFNQRQRMQELFEWIAHDYPDLQSRIAWNQPMFTHHDTFIIGFSIAKNHMAVAPELAAMIHFAEMIKHSGYSTTQQLIRIPWNQPVDYQLLAHLIEFNMMDKADCQTFWRK